MKTSDLFNPNDILDLENALFSGSEQEVKYCLIQKSQKYFYISTTVHISNVLKRMRAMLFNTDLDVAAYNLQKTVRATNLADWTIVVFKNKNFDDHVIKHALHGYTQLHKASRYEVHGKENIKVYLLEHRRYGVQLYLSTAIELTDTQFNSRAKNALKTRSAHFKDKVLNATQKELYAKVNAAALHSGTGDWKIVEVDIPLLRKDDVPSFIRDCNKKFLDLSYRVY